MAQTPPPFDHDADGNQDQAEDQKPRRHHVGENADVRRRVAGEKVDQDQKNNVGQRHRRQGEADQADRVLNEILAKPADDRA